MKTIYLVKQYQEGTEYWDKTIHAFSSLKKAVEKCKDLNKEYFAPGEHWYEYEDMELE